MPLTQCCALFSASCQERTVLVCLIPGVVNLDYLVKVLSTRFFHCQVASYSLAVNRYLGREIVKLCRYPVCFSFSPTPNLTFCEWVLLAIVISGVSLMVLGFLSSVFINHIYFPSFLIQTFYICIHSYLLLTLLVIIQYYHYFAHVIPDLALCPFDKLRSFLEHLLTLWNLKMLQVHFEFSLLQPWSHPLQQGALAPLIGEW